MSVSRRTNIPAYYADWFSTALKKVTRIMKILIPISLSLPISPPGNVKTFVFWSRNPQPLFKHLNYIDQNYNNKH
jgi:hypothetical protein